MYACSKKASNVCNIILSNLRHFDNSLLTLLFCVFARPHIEYASVIYNPYQLQYIDLDSKTFRENLRNDCMVCIIFPIVKD